MFLCSCVYIPRGAHLGNVCVGSVGGDFAMGACKTLRIEVPNM